VATAACKTRARPHKKESRLLVCRRKSGPGGVSAALFAWAGATRRPANAKGPPIASRTHTHTYMRRGVPFLHTRKKDAPRPIMASRKIAAQLI